MTPTIDAIDLKLLSLLQRDGRISNQMLAEAVALSPSACLRRVRALEENGLIDGYRAVLNQEKIGLEIEAIVQITMRQDNDKWHDTFVAALQVWPEVISAQIVTGESHYVLRVVAPNLKHYSDFIIEKLHRTPGVMDIRSNIVMRTVKAVSAIDVQLIGRS